jgi:hypothetical protein
MSPENFVYWLNGFAELNGAAPTAEQWASIQEHLALVLKKETPAVKPAQLNPEALQDWFKKNAQGATPGSPIPPPPAPPPGRTIKYNLTC